MDLNIHEEYMERAIYLAEKGRGKVCPNPMVGCVIVKRGEIIGNLFIDKFYYFLAKVILNRIEALSVLSILLNILL